MTMELKNQKCKACSGNTPKFDKKQINQSGHTPILLNFRRPAISSNNSLNIIKKTNSLVFSNDMLQIDEKLLSKKIEEKSMEIIQYIENNEKFCEFDFFDVDHSKVIKKQVIKILKERLEEYFWQIECCKFLDKQNDVIAGLSLNLSGETEVIFSKIKKNTELILLQHGFSNYYDFNHILTIQISSLEILNGNEFTIRDFPKPEYILTPIVARQQIRQVFAPAGTGKTLKMLHEAAAIVSGYDFLHYKNKFKY